jgi:hypothetical protein
MINNTDVELTTWQGIDKLGLKLQENNDISNINFKARIVLVDDMKKLSGANPGFQVRGGAPCETV